VSFTKANNATAKEIAIEVRHPWHKEDVFVFHFPKRQPKPAAESEARFLGLGEEAREDEHRLAIIEAVSEMVTAVEGFDDFPQDSRPLPERFREYFDDPEQLELEQLVVSAWRAYRASAIPGAYLKSPVRDGAGSNRVPPATA